MSHLTASEAAAELEARYQISCRPRDVSDAIYERRIDVGRCPLQAGRRLIPRELLPDLATVLRHARRG